MDDEIKLVIWDLDDTLWDGIISESSVKLRPYVKNTIEDTLDAGIMHSICSKNDFEQCRHELSSLGIWENFVFPSIDWTPKGPRIKKIIDTMKLRALNVLFVDDNVANLQEAKYYCKGIKTSVPEEVCRILQPIKAGKNTGHKRLEQYKTLEKKEKIRTDYDNDKDFLMSCGIKVEIVRDCIQYLDRIHELVMRATQLNYTKKRSSLDELKAIILDRNTDTGVVFVRDNFGDYGISGFFAMKNKTLEHFLFSCRVLGMSIEQYVFVTLGSPEINISGSTAAKLQDKYLPEWINNNTETPSAKYTKGGIKRPVKILLKGPCDLLQVMSFIKKTDSIVCEFSYVNEKEMLVEGCSHTAQTATSIKASGKTKTYLAESFPYFDTKMFETSIGKEKFDYIFFSLLADGSLGVYKSRHTDELISMNEKYYDMTDSKNWDMYINGSIFGEDIKYTKDILSAFSREYEFVENEDWNITLQSLNTIAEAVCQDTIIVLMLGTERPYSKEKRPSFLKRHIEHMELNKKITDWAKKRLNIKIIRYDDYVCSESDYVDSIDHYRKSVYYRLAQDIINMINQHENEQLKIRSKFFVLTETIFSMMKRFVRKFILRRL